MFRHFVQLTKPRVTAMTVFMAAGGMFLAGRLPWLNFLMALLGVLLSVGCANGLNMAIERRTDAMMRRTADRPIPAGRLNAKQAVLFSLTLGVLSMFLLLTFTNPITAILGLLAIVVYAGIYTPLKLKSTIALPIGAIPGAVPPLMGYTAVSNEITAEALALFAILGLWQIPHFLAISVANLEDYSSAGIQTVPGEKGNRITRLQTIAYTTVLIPLSLVLVPLGTAGWFYGSVALVSGTALLYLAANEPSEGEFRQWAVRYFKGTLWYLPVVTVALALDSWGITR